MFSVATDQDRSKTNIRQEQTHCKIVNPVQMTKRCKRSKAADAGMMKNQKPETNATEQCCNHRNRAEAKCNKPTKQMQKNNTAKTTNPQQL